MFRESAAGGLFTFIVTLALIAALIIGGLVMYNIWQEPYRQQGFSGQVQGLVTEYCTAPRLPDQDAARQQLDNLAYGEPSRFSQLPTALREKANRMRDNDRGVCK